MIDFGSSTWHSLKAHLENQLQFAREKNDSKLSPDETAELRGRIAAIKELLALPRASSAQEELTKMAGPLYTDNQY
jgi:hypothetical protein